MNTESKTILTFDFGTTSVKTCIFDASLQVLAECNREYRLITDGKSRVEMEPETYWNHVVESTKEVCNIAGIHEIAAVICSSQGETLIPVDKNGTPLCNAIVWLDARAEEEADIMI